MHRLHLFVAAMAALFQLYPMISGIQFLCMYSE